MPGVVRLTATHHQRRFTIQERRLVHAVLGGLNLIFPPITMEFLIEHSEYRAK